MCFPFSSNIVAHLLLINIPHFTDVGCKGIMLATPTELNEMIFFSISQKKCQFNDVTLTFSWRPRSLKPAAE